MEGNQHLIQVCSSLEDPKTFEREVGALQQVAKEHPHAQKCIVTLETASGVPEDVFVYDAAAWFLDAQNA